MAALHDTLAITIVDGDVPIATADVEPDLDESGDVTGQYEPLVEFRVLRYSLLPDFERVRPVLRAAGAANHEMIKRHDELTASERETLMLAVKAGEAIAKRFVIHDESGAPMEGRVAHFQEWDYGSGPLHAIRIAMALKYVQPPPRPRPPVVITLRDATIDSFVRDVFDHATPDEGREAWYFPYDVSFEIDEHH